MLSQIKKSLIHFRYAIAATAITFATTSCGWQLRGYEPKTQRIASAETKIHSLSISSENRSNAFFRIFRNTLLNQNIELINDATLRVSFSAESLRRQPLTYSRTGVPAQYQLSLSMRYLVSQEQNVIVEEREIISRRNYDFDPNLIIAKDREEQELLEEMRRELSERILTSIRQAL